MALGLRAMPEGARSIWAWQADPRRFPATHGVFARNGGVSRPPFATLNLGLHTGDDAHAVVANRKAALATLGLSLDDAVAAEQVHGERVAEVGASHRGMGAFEYASAVRGVDALITSAKGVALFGYFADCLPVLISDRQGAWIGLAHAGWKGSVLGIASNAVRALKSRGVGAERLRVALGPCIGPCCYEVGDEVALAFQERYGDSVVKRTRSGKRSVDLTLANTLALIAEGVAPDSIIQSRLCTACRTDLFFSHRVEGPQTGRIAAVIAL